MTPKSRLSFITMAASILASCATVPPPSKFVGVKWSGPQGFAETTAYIKNGRFVGTPRKISEVIDLTGLYAVSPTGAPIPTVGTAADFDLYRQQPTTNGQPTARVRGGKLVK